MIPMGIMFAGMFFMPNHPRELRFFVVSVYILLLLLTFFTCMGADQRRTSRLSPGNLSRALRDGFGGRSGQDAVLLYLLRSVLSGALASGLVALLGWCVSVLLSGNPFGAMLGFLILLNGHAVTAMRRLKETRQHLTKLFANRPTTAFEMRGGGR